MNMYWKNHQSPCKRQRGMTLIELLVAGVISLIAVFGMVLVMANTLGTGSQTIHMSRLTHEMRTSMQIMTRELRRANYHAGYMSCLGDSNCRQTLDIAGVVAEINISNSNDCFWFWYDRPQDVIEVAVTAEFVAAFRRDTDANGIGTLQMTTLETGAANCNQDDGWLNITDPGIIDVTAFNVTDAQSYTEATNTTGTTQSVERIGITMIARLRADASVPAWLQSNVNATRQLQDFITVRNNITTVPAP